MRPTGGLFFGIGIAIVLSKIAPLRHVLCYFGQRTLPIYLVHVLFISAMTSLAAALQIPHFAIFGAPVLTTAAVAGSLLLARSLQWVGADWMLSPVAATPRIRSAA